MHNFELSVDGDGKFDFDDGDSNDEWEFDDEEGPVNAGDFFGVHNANATLRAILKRDAIKSAGGYPTR